MIPKILLALFAAISLSACNTVAGAGKDVSAAGTAVTGSADEAQKPY